MKYYGSDIKHFLDAANELLNNQNNPETHTMVVFSINHLKEINTRYGFDTGCELISYVHNILKAYINKPQLFSDFNTNHFAIFLNNYKKIDLALLVIQLTEEISNYNKDINITLSFGICQAGPLDDNINRIYKRALLAKNCIKSETFRFLADYNEIEQRIIS